MDLPAWLSQLTGGSQWEVYSEAEEESCISFAMRQASSDDSVAISVSKAVSKLPLKLAPKPVPKEAQRFAEVTLYHNGYAIVDVDGQSLFDGSLTSGGSDFAHLTYYHADSGEKITLN